MFMFEQIATDLQHKSTELHFLKAALNNLELAQVAQEDQKSSWARFTGDAIREFKLRTETLQADITELTAKQDALYKTTFGQKKQEANANDQISMSMGYL